MNTANSIIDNNNSFDFGKTSDDYAKYRDIYPDIFYKKIIDRNLCVRGQNVLDLGTGTGVLPRNMYSYGANWIGTDISENQINSAKKLSNGMPIKYYTMPTENLSFPNNFFDVITACQCFWYFDHKKIAPILSRLLKPSGSILILYMAWLPNEDKIAKASEQLVLKFNPDWSGGNEKIHPIFIPKCYDPYFKLIYHDEYTVKVNFTRESWHGRMKTCRGIGASLSKDKIYQWEKEHITLLNKIAPESFDIMHYIAIAELRHHRTIYTNP